MHDADGVSADAAWEAIFPLFAVGDSVRAEIGVQGQGGPLRKPAAGGRVPVQLRFAIELTGEQYVIQQAWCQARLDRCPLHPGGGCEFHRHGSYGRKYPDGTRIARWYCRTGHRTFSLLPDCLCSRLCGTLAEVEEVVVAMECAPSQEAAAQSLRIEIDLPGALRWMRRRQQLIGVALLALIGLLPHLLSGARPSVKSFRCRLEAAPVLPRLRALGAEYLAKLGPPLGFGPHTKSRPPPIRGVQQSMGTVARAGLGVNRAPKEKHHAR